MPASRRTPAPASASAEANINAGGNNNVANTDERIDTTLGDEIINTTFSDEINNNLTDMEGIETTTTNAISESDLHNIVSNEAADFDFDAEIKKQIRATKDGINHYNTQIATGLLTNRQVEHALSVINQKHQILKQLYESEKLMNSNNVNPSKDNNYEKEKYIMPKKLPIFQFKNHPCKDAKHTYTKIDECLADFEAALSSVSLDFDLHWERLLRPQISLDMRQWLDEFKDKYSHTQLQYKDVKAALIQKYGISPAEISEQAFKDLNSLQMTRDMNIEQLKEKFQKLVREAEINNDQLLVNLFKQALFPALRESVEIGIASSAVEDRSDLEKIMAATTLIYKGTYEKRLQPKKHETNRKINNNYNNNQKNRSNGTYCILHGNNGTHNTDNCKVLLAKYKNNNHKNNSNNNYSNNKYNNKKFGSPTNRSQNYKKNKKWNNNSHNKNHHNKNNSNSNIVPTNYPGKNEDTTMEDQSSDDERESGLTFRSMIKNSDNNK